MSKWIEYEFLEFFVIYVFLVGMILTTWFLLITILLLLAFCIFVCLKFIQILIQINSKKNTKNWKHWNKCKKNFLIHVCNHVYIF